MKTAKIVSRSVSPRFSHDCDCCLFVGQLDGEDLYRCESAIEDECFIRRFGNEPSENGSMPMAIPGTPYALASKLAMRVRRGERPRGWRTA